MVAFLKLFELLQFFDRLTEFILGTLQLIVQLMRGIAQIVSAIRSGLRKSRICKMSNIRDPDALLLGPNLVIKFVSHTVELGNHALDLSKLPSFFINLKPLQTDQTVAGFHNSILP